MNANVIYDGDEYISKIDVATGRRELVSHDSPFENRNDNKIKGAYAIVQFNDGTSRLEEMTMQEIVNSWNMGNANGNSPAHKNFKGEMCKKTVISRALKTVINSSSDSALMGEDEPVQNQSEADLSLKVEKKANKQSIGFDESNFEDAKVEEPEKKPEPAQGKDQGNKGKSQGNSGTIEFD